MLIGLPAIFRQNQKDCWGSKAATFLIRGGMLTDAHSHVYDVGILDILTTFNIYTMACGTEPSECESLRSWSRICPQCIPTYGLHPWKTSRFSVESMLPYLNECHVIGEIGLDGRWIKAPPSAQLPAFLRQMDVAQRRDVPVILHTPGKEGEIAAILRDYSIPVVAHWFASERHLDAFLARDCYFTVGSTVDREPGVMAVAKHVPMSRLLIETDGISAIGWCQKRKVPAEELPVAIERIVGIITGLRGVGRDEVLKSVNENFFRIVNHYQKGKKVTSASSSSAKSSAVPAPIQSTA
jgi:TatD DNase family protein